MKPSLLIILPDLAPGGAQPMNIRLAQQLAQRGWQLRIAVLFDRHESLTSTALKDLDVRRMRATGLLGKLALPLRLARMARDSHVLLGGMELAATTYGHLAARLSSRPFLSWTHIAFHKHQTATAWSDRWVARSVYRHVRWIVFPSHGAADSLSTALGQCPRSGQWQVIENFLLPQHNALIHPPPLPDAFSKPVVIGLGRLVKQKAFHRLICAHAMLRDRGVDHHLVLLGDGPLRQELLALATRLGVDKTVFLPGHVPDPANWLAHSSVFGLCSEYEGFPLAILEAMQAGVPIVSMDCPSGPREALDGGRFGALVPDGDQRAFESALHELLQSPERRVHYSRLGKERAEYYSAERIVPLWEDLLLRVARSRP